MSVACTMWSHLSNQNITIMLGKSFLKLYFTTTSCQILINYVNILKNNPLFKKKWFLTNIIMWPFHCYLFYSIFPWNQHITKITKPKLSHTVTNLDEPDTIPETQHTFTEKYIQIHHENLVCYANKEIFHAYAVHDPSQPSVQKPLIYHKMCPTYQKIYHWIVKNFQFT